MTSIQAPPETATATAYVPAPPREQWTLAARCPYCGHTHMHRVRRWFGAHVVKAPHCRPWLTYTVKVERVDLTGGQP